MYPTIYSVSHEKVTIPLYIIKARVPIFMGHPVFKLDCERKRKQSCSRYAMGFNVLVFRFEIGGKLLP